MIRGNDAKVMSPISISFQYKHLSPTMFCKVEHFGDCHMIPTCLSGNGLVAGLSSRGTFCCVECIRSRLSQAHITGCKFLMKGCMALKFFRAVCGVIYSHRILWICLSNFDSQLFKVALNIIPQRVHLTSINIMA